jgi:hypothetical protein
MNEYCRMVRSHKMMLPKKHDPVALSEYLSALDQLDSKSMPGMTDTYLPKAPGRSQHQISHRQPDDPRSHAAVTGDSGIPEALGPVGATLG